MLEIFQYDFLVRSLVSGALVGIAAPLIGIFIVLKRQAFLSDALAHISLLGVALASLLGFSPALGAIGISALAGIGIETLRFSGRLFRDSSLVIFFSGSLALAIVLLNLSGGLSGKVMGYLFGSLSTVSGSDFFLLLGVFFLSVLFVYVFARRLFLIVLHEDIAVASGIRVRRINILFAAVAAAIAASSLQAVGALLVGSLMTIPVYAAMQWRFGFRGTLLLSVFFSLFSVIFGFFLSFSFRLPSGAAVILLAILFFVFSYFFGRKIAKR